MIGRGADCQLILDDDYVSTRHARVVGGEDGIYVEDLGSTNGTYVNGQRITAPTMITLADTVRIGKTIMKLEPVIADEPLQLRFVTHSEIGLVRKNNQDSGFASPRLLVVADGMGGAAAGDLASAVAIDTIQRIDTAGRAARRCSRCSPARSTGPTTGSPISSRTTHSLDGMGTTVTGALFDGTELGLAHIGDSRAYLLRDGRLERLTHDHSWVQSLVDDGKISEAEAASTRTDRCC